jgi:hypothetical protein
VKITLYKWSWNISSPIGLVMLYVVAFSSLFQKCRYLSKNNTSSMHVLPTQKHYRKWANQSLLFLLNDMHLEEKQQIPILFSLVWKKIEPSINRTQSDHSNHNTMDVVTTTCNKKQDKGSKSPTFHKKQEKTSKSLNFISNLNIQCKEKIVCCEWLLFNANSAIAQLHQNENKLIFDEMMMTRSTLY